MAVAAERRVARPVDLDELGIQNPGLKRIERNMIRVVSEDDEVWEKEPDESRWLVKYKLLKHLLNSQLLLVEVGHERGSDGELAVRATGGFYHDISKREEPFRSLYRKNDRLTKKERKIMLRHTKRSAEILDELKLEVRQENRAHFEYSRPIVRWHDKPYRIFSTWQRIICWDLYFIDGYLAAREKRQDRSLSVEEALASLDSRSVVQLPLAVRIWYRQEIEESLRFVKATIRRKVLETRTT